MTARSTACGVTMLSTAAALPPLLGSAALRRARTLTPCFWRDIQNLNGQALDVMWKKLLEKAVFPEKITGKKVAFFCRQICRQNVFCHFL
jgi:hypothetical protein